MPQRVLPGGDQGTDFGRAASVQSGVWVRRGDQDEVVREPVGIDRVGDGGAERRAGTDPRLDALADQVKGS